MAYSFGWRILGGLAALLFLPAIGRCEDAPVDPDAGRSATQEELDRQDHVRQLQKEAETAQDADWCHWGKDPSKFSTWTNHSNRLIPIYTFGLDLSGYTGERSCYRDPQQVEQLYGYLPPGTVNSRADYLDQTDVYDLQRDAVNSGKKYIILIVFDGMDWETTRAASIYRTGSVYDSGRGNGLFFQDYRGVATDYHWFVTSPHNSGTNVDVDAQTVLDDSTAQRGGYNPLVGGPTPWARPRVDEYLLGQYRKVPHAVTDSASSATSMTCGIKTFNAAINVDSEGTQVVSLARQLQAERGFSIGVVTSVPISHATPAAAYANNVSRNDYQDLSRDLVGLPSIAHRQQPLPGVDVLLGAGWGEVSDKDDKQGANYVPGNKYLPDADINRIDAANGGAYVVAQRTPGRRGREVLMDAARRAYMENKRLFGFFGVSGGQLPYRTADGSYNPYKTRYTEADRLENPTLADYTQAALGMLSKDPDGFWLMVEAGDVDWANHANNVDNAIGAVYSGDDAFRMVVAWIEKRKAWKDTAVILTADHGHYMVLDRPEALIPPAAARTAERR